MDLILNIVNNTAFSPTRNWVYKPNFFVDIVARSIKIRIGIIKTRIPINEKKRSNNLLISF
jgi:hypothetical protein